MSWEAGQSDNTVPAPKSQRVRQKAKRKSKDLYQPKRTCLAARNPSTVKTVATASPNLPQASSMLSRDPQGSAILTLPSQVQQVVPHKQRVDLSENVLRMNVSVLNIESPGVFFVRNQLSQKIFDSMAGLADYLNEKGQLVPLEELVPGVVCAIKSSTEGKWLRCRILQVGNGKWAKVGSFCWRFLFIQKYIFLQKAIP